MDIEKIIEFGENHFFGECYLKWEQMKEFIVTLPGNQRASEGEETKKEYTIRKYQEYIKFVKDNKGGNGFVFWLEKESD